MIQSAIREHLRMFECPVCGADIKDQDEGSLYCANRHCFDFSKEGYVNFLNASVRTRYDKTLFDSRRIVIKSGFFDPLLEFLGNRIAGYGVRGDGGVGGDGGVRGDGDDRGGRGDCQDGCGDGDDRGDGREDSQGRKSLDAGCGEGSHLAGIKKYLMNPFTKTPIMAGLDVSKFGVRAAASGHSEIMWCVADLTRIPLKKEQFDYIVNILAPAHYEEFRRCLKKKGLLIKVVPSEDHLKELRDYYYEGTDKQSYSGRETAQRFRERFGALETARIRYPFELRNWDQLIHFIQMTPLSWHVAETKPMIRPWRNMSLTADFTVMIGIRG
jgi:23S rRNA (guanine745-N1)-methyltransferase